MYEQFELKNLKILLLLTFCDLTRFMAGSFYNIHEDEIRAKYNHFFPSIACRRKPCYKACYQSVLKLKFEFGPLHFSAAFSLPRLFFPLFTFSSLKAVVGTKPFPIARVRIANIS